MPAFSRDLERTLSKATAIADVKGSADETLLRIAHYALCGMPPHKQAKAKMAAVAQFSRANPFHCIMESQEV